MDYNTYNWMTTPTALVFGSLMILSLLWVCIAYVMYWKTCRKIDQQKAIQQTRMQEYVEARGYTELPMDGPVLMREHPSRVSDVVPIRVRKRA